MACRPVFAVGDQFRAVVRRDVDFLWFAGMADCQKRKCIDSLHEAYTTRFPAHRVLEISSKSRDELGVRLSAFNLTKYVPSLGKSVPVECLFQGGKMFWDGVGPFTDLYTGLPIDAKRDRRVRSSGPVEGFWYEGREFPNKPASAFYCWLWCSALMEHPDLAEQILHYDGFTDIVFNPEKSQNCQAEAAAIFVTLARRGQLDQIADFDTFVRLL